MIFTNSVYIVNKQNERTKDLHTVYAIAKHSL